ncbi:MAG: hypothetical protein GXP62_20450 [Oligoflexia bacterium]|nr:hypothetical protein [Oligoflexia bacterium]
MNSWFTALKAAKSGGTVARAIMYGDSTVAADGLARTVRARLQARFGDAGPGFVPASFLPMWSVRADVAAHRFGHWKWRTILYGGGGGHYGLGGIVGILHAGDGVVLRAIDAQAQTRSLRHIEAWYQAGVGYGTLTLQLDQGDPRLVDASASATEDRFSVIDAPVSSACVSPPRAEVCLSTAWCWRPERLVLPGRPCR